VPRPNPLTADSAGRFPDIWAPNGSSYTVVWKDASGTIISTHNDIVPFGVESLTGGTATGTANAIEVDIDDFDEIDGQIITFIAAATNTGAATVTVSGVTYDIVQDTAGGPAALDGDEIIAGNFIALGYDKAGDQFHIVSIPPPQAQGTIDANLTASVNDWHPTGLATAECIRITASAAWNITGIDAPSADGVQLVLLNVDTADAITLVSESASSAAANRFSFNSNVTLGIKESATVRYDATSARWRLIARGYSGGSYNYAKVTANGDWTVPGNVTAATPVKFRGCGGGGGGGGANTTDGAAGSGGGSGAYFELVLTGFTAGQNVTVAIGAAGAAGAAGANGGAGGNTTLTYNAVTVLTAAGGALGQGATTAVSQTGGDAGANTFAVGASGLTEGFSMLQGAQPGGASAAAGSTLGASGHGGGNPFGTGGKSKGAVGVGQAGTGFGAGGGGAYSDSTALAGGAGTAGVVLIEWWL
jgi:hypothetical protein